MHGTRQRKKKGSAVLISVLILALVALASYVHAERGRGADPDAIPVGNTGQMDMPDKGTEPAESDPVPEPTEPEETDDTPAPDEDWLLILVNPWNSMPEDYEVTLQQLQNGHAVDERCYPALQQMMDDCRTNGLSPLICSSFRTWETQERLYNNKVRQMLDKGHSEEQAKIEAGRIVAVPGTSEHQLGLAVDIVDVNNQNLNSSQEKTAVQQWLMANSWRYGFILRYPSDKSELTGIIYEPWHYRYVGEEIAQYIYENGICFEEYLEQLS